MQRIANRVVAFSAITTNSPTFIQVRKLHVSSPLCFFFMKKQVTVDPHIARVREDRKRRKLQVAIAKLEKFSKKPRPVEELEIDIKLKKTLAERAREAELISEEERQRRVRVKKQYGRSRARMANQDIRDIRHAIESQRRALEMLKMLSPKLYDAAVKPDLTLLPMEFEGPALTAPLANYRSPDGAYVDITKHWEVPTMESLIKLFGVGKLIKTPAFKKKQDETQAKKKAEEEKKLAIASG